MVNYVNNLESLSWNIHFLLQLGLKLYEFRTYFVYFAQKIHIYKKYQS